MLSQIISQISAFINEIQKIHQKNSKNIFIPLKICCIIIVYQNLYGVKIMEKIQIKIANEVYNIMTDDNLEYVAKLGEELDAKLSALINNNSRISVTQAAILTALEYADSAKKCEITAENLRNQIQEYLEESARSRTDVEIMKRENERLLKEIASLKAAK